MTIYQEIILDHASHPRNMGRINGASKSVTVHNSLCGDRIDMDVLLEGERVGDVKFEGIGCAISKASASLLTEYAKGKTKEELKKLDKQAIMDLLGIQLGPNRLKCALLSLEALKKLLI